jgi:hypothetical protein
MSKAFDHSQSTVSGLDPSDPLYHVNRSVIVLYPGEGTGHVLIDCQNARTETIMMSVFDSIEEAIPLIEAWAKHPPEKNLEFWQKYTAGNIKQQKPTA